MAGHAPLTQNEIDALIAKLQIYKYIVAFGSTILGPLKSAPKVEPDIETKEVKLYETGDEIQAEFLTKNDLKVTVELEDMDTAATMLAAFKKGDNLLDSDLAKALTLQPVTDDASAKTITFPNAYLRPGWKPTFEDADDPNSTSLEFLCKPAVEGTDAGKPFVYGTSSGSSVSTGSEE